MNIEELIRRTRLVEAKMDEMEKEFKNVTLKPYKDAAEAMRNTIQEWMIENKQLSTKTEAGQAVLAKKTSYRVEDQLEFKRHVIGTEDWEMIVWGVKRSAAEAFQLATQTLPPGVVKSTILELRLLAPEKKRVHKSVSVSSVEGELDKTFDPFTEEDALADATQNEEQVQ